MTLALIGGRRLAFLDRFSSSGVSFGGAIETVSLLSVPVNSNGTL
jgi:hypothetical protein